MTPPAPIRAVVMGSAKLACPALEALASASGVRVAAVVTQPDRPQGRSLQVLPSPVKTAAALLGLPVLQPDKARDPTFIAQLAALEPHLIVVAAYGQILPAAILNLPPFGCVNVHASLLPKYRGAAPIQWAILNGDEITGVTVMQMDPGLDTGPILAQRTEPIHPGDTGRSLHDRLAKIGAELLLEILPDYLSGKIQPQPQPLEGAIYARKITKDDGRIVWTDAAVFNERKIRAFDPWPGAFAYLPEPRAQERLKIWKAEAITGAPPAAPGMIAEKSKESLRVACGDGALALEIVQRPGGKKLSIQQFLSGCPLELGARFL